MKKTFLVFIFVVLIAPFARAQQISAEERKIIDYIDAHQADAVALLEKTVNVESPTENLAGVRGRNDF